MRPIDVPTHSNLGRVQSEIRFRLDAASTAHIVGLLTNQYSDSLLAALRELATNAADSHISAKNLAPIQVTLPTLHAPHLVVEDFGLGLSIDELEDLYSAYGASTKRESDDVNGTLGIGSKAPLAYADTFSLRARKGGVQVLAVVVKDEDGVPLLRVLDTSATSEADGVRIEVPIRQYDFPSLARKAQDLFYYWQRGTVLVDGVEPELLVWDDQELIWLDDDVAVSLQRNKSVVVQHGVPYPIDYGRIDLRFSVIAFVPSGTVKFAPSREALEYTDRTVGTIKVLQEYAQDALQRSIQKRLDEARTPFDKLRVAREWKDLLPGIVGDHFKTYGVSIPIGGHGFGWSYRPDAYRKKATKVEHLKTTGLISDYPVIIGYDLKTLTERARLKVDTYFEDTAHKEFLLLPSGTDLKALSGRPNVLRWETIDAATPNVEPPKAARGSKSATVYEVRQGNRCFALTLASAKAYIEDHDIDTVVYGVDHTNRTRWGYERTNNVERIATRLPEALVFDIKSNQIEKIERELDAVEGYEEISRQLEAVRPTLTAADILKAKISEHSFFLGGLKGSVESIEDPDIKAVFEIFATPKSDRLRRFEQLGGSLGEVGLPEDNPVAVTAERYPLLSRGSSRTYVRQDEVDDAILYLNTKYSQTTTQAQAKEQS